MNAKMKKKMEELANKEYPPQYIHGADICTSLRTGYHAGFEARDKIAQEREAKLVEALEYYKTGKVLFIDGTVNTTVAEKALADYKAEGEE